MPRLPPSEAEYNLAQPHRVWFSQCGQMEFLWPLIIERMKTPANSHPFFLESGARDGEEHSNSLALERSYGWQGLLIEPGQEYSNLL